VKALSVLAVFSLLVDFGAGQTPQSAVVIEPAKPRLEAESGEKVETVSVKSPEFTVVPGTRVPLALVNTVTTKHSQPGDKIYLETAFPIFVDRRLVIPQGSYVIGSVTQVKRAGRVKGRAELYVRFDSITLPNGTQRDFRGRATGMDGRDGQEIDREEGKIRGEGGKSRDASIITGSASTGAMGGVLASGTRGGLLGGGLAGAAAGVVAVLVTRGPDASLQRGMVVEIELDRPLTYAEDELDFSRSFTRSNVNSNTGAPAEKKEQWRRPLPF
jgi:hypothetical protein